MVAAPIVAAPATGATQEPLVSVVVQLDMVPLARRSGQRRTHPTAPGAATTEAATHGRLDARTASSQAHLRRLDDDLGAFETTARGIAPTMQRVHRYRSVLGGVSLRVPERAIAALRDLPGVRAMLRDGVAYPHTERSPRFVGTSTLWRKLGGTDSAGEGVVVGILDTGVWPEHPSFADPDPRGVAYPAPPLSWHGGAGPECEAPGPADLCAPLTCNNKLIGAFAFLDTYKASVGLLPGECDSARDTDGHGTHTASTAAGNAHVENDIEPRRTLSGIAPRSHVAIYRVCAAQGCFFSDSAAAIDQAVLDGVDVINFSIGGGVAPYSDIVSLAFRDAYAAGVFVAASAGNDGPGVNTVAHREPWVTTVAASTHDRAFQSTVTLRGGGASLRARGASIASGNGALGTIPTVLASSFGDTFCLNPFAPGTFTGKIVVCQRGIVARASKSFNVAAGNAAGMILYNPVMQGIATDNHFVPSIHLEADDGAELLTFMATHGNVTARLRGTRTRRPKRDVVAPFSSRGGSAQSLGISKPDITAPGVQILAGNSPLKHATDGSAGEAGRLFQVIQGTSMSSPHVAGAAALLRALHPDWTAGQIKSALMTSARIRRLFDSDATTPADVFDVGSGRLDLRRAGQPGLTFDVPTQDYIDGEHDLWNTNYPSVFVPAAAGMTTLSVMRYPHNEADRGLRYRVRVRTPDGSRLGVTTVPEQQLQVPPNGDAALQVDIDLSAMNSGEVGTATIELRGGGHVVRLPVTAVRP